MKEGKKERTAAGEFTYGQPVPPENLPLEDMILKSAVRYFGEELLAYLGINHKIAGVAPTELVYLEVKGLIEDFTYIVSDGSWIHLEFESDQVTEADLRRFRGYEAVTSYTYQVSVTTIVICSANAKSVMSELREGINTYRVHTVRLKDWDADQLFKRLDQKRLRGGGMSREDLIPVLLSPLMAGEMPQKERFIKGNRLLKDSENLTTEEESKMQAVLYALAVKFLDLKALEEVKEEFAMTLLGEMLVKDGMKKGIERGRTGAIKEMAMRMRKNGEPYGKIAKYTGTTVDTIRAWENEET